MSPSSLIRLVLAIISSHSTDGPIPPDGKNYDISSRKNPYGILTLLQGPVPSSSRACPLIAFIVSASRACPLIAPAKSDKVTAESWWWVDKSEVEGGGGAWRLTTEERHGGCHGDRPPLPVPSSPLFKGLSPHHPLITLKGLSPHHTVRSGVALVESL